MPITEATIRARKLLYPQTDAEYLAYWKSRCVVSERGCWEFQGFLFDNGYPGGSYRGKGGRLHRFAYMAAKGPIPTGHDVCHSCDVRHCINPDHLWTGTRQQNLMDCLLKGRHHHDQVTHCPRGHDFAIHGRAINTGKGTGKGRQCTACERGRNRMKLGWPEDLAYSAPPGTKFRTERRRSQETDGSDTK